MNATMMQTSAPVGDGALGGPVVNLRGEVIGISTRRAESQRPASLEPAPGSGYALPINLATAIYESLIARGSTESPWLGISVLPVADKDRAKPGMPRVAGIAIDNVFDPSPAAEAGIRVGDVLTSLGGQTITTVYDFQRLLYAAGVGKRVTLGIVRDGKTLEVTTTIAKRPPDATTR
jgi:serine protease Do